MLDEAVRAEAHLAHLRLPRHAHEHHVGAGDDVGDARARADSGSSALRNARRHDVVPDHGLSRCTREVAAHATPHHTETDEAEG